MQQAIHPRGLIAALMASTGLSEAGVRKALREKRPPRNPLIAALWRQTVERFGKAAK